MPKLTQSQKVRRNSRLPLIFNLLIEFLLLVAESVDFGFDRCFGSKAVAMKKFVDLLGRFAHGALFLPSIGKLGLQFIQPVAVKTQNLSQHIFGFFLPNRLVEQKKCVFR